MTSTAEFPTPSARFVRLEASTHCQLGCPACPTPAGRTAQQLGRGYLTARDFTQFLTNHPEVRNVELSNWGEAFLNPELAEILAHAAALNVRLRIDGGANLNNAKADALEALVRHRVESLTVAIDGASPRTYRIYRHGGSLRAVIRNVRTILRWKRLLRSPYPLLRWQFIAFPHNAHEIPRARRLARLLEMEFLVKPPWSGPQPAAESARSWELGLSRAVDRKFCAQLWNQPQVNWDGRMLGCCVNLWGDYGNVFDSGVDAILHGRRMNDTRAMLRGRIPPRQDIPCVQCKTYRNMAAGNRWLTSGEIMAYRLFQRCGRYASEIPRAQKILRKAGAAVLWVVSQISL